MEILMIDDEKEYIEQTTRILKRFANDVEIVSGESKNLVEAIGQIQRHQPECILLDSYFCDKLIGPDIARHLEEVGFIGMVISYSTNSSKEQAETYKDYPIVKHFVRKSPFDLRKCLKGDCDCAALFV